MSIPQQVETIAPVATDVSSTSVVTDTSSIKKKMPREIAKIKHEIRSGVPTSSMAASQLSSWELFLTDGKLPHLKSIPKKMFNKLLKGLWFNVHEQSADLLAPLLTLFDNIHADPNYEYPANIVTGIPVLFSLFKVASAVCKPAKDSGSSTRPKRQVKKSVKNQQPTTKATAKTKKAKSTKKSTNNKAKVRAKSRSTKSSKP